MNNKIKLILRNAFNNPGSKSIILDNDLRRVKRFIDEIRTLTNSLEMTDLACDSVGYRYFYLINTSMICGLVNNPDYLHGTRANFVYLNDEFDQKTIQEIAIPFLSINFNPKEQEKIMEMENELVKLGIIQEWEKTEFQKNELFDLTKIED